MLRIYFHVDLDAFFASVEQADTPQYRGKPLIVGAKPGNRGVVSACSYEARKFGIHSAMPISQAYQKCRHGIFVRPRMERYSEMSRMVMDILKEYTPQFKQISIDEASMDMTGTRRLFGPPEKVGKEIMERVKKQTGLTLSIGIAPNRFLAKLASEINKPDGLFLVQPGKEEAFLDRLKLKDLWGLGKKTLLRLRELNITTIPALREFPLNMLTSMVGKATGNFLYRAVRGESPEIHTNEAPKNHSISNEITFETDRKELYYLRNVLLELSHQLMRRLLHEKGHAKTVFIKIRYSDFTTVSQQKTLKHHIFAAEEIFQVAQSLLDKKWDGRTPIRLIGLGLSNIDEKGEHTQGELFEDPLDKKNRVEEAIFELHQKFDHLKLTKASLLKEDHKKHKRG